MLNKLFINLFSRTYGAPRKYLTNYGVFRLFQNLNSEERGYSDEDQNDLESEDPVVGIQELKYDDKTYKFNKQRMLQKRRKKEEEMYKYSKNLVIRPHKGYLWGLGSEAFDQNKDYFREGEVPRIKELIEFLEDMQCKEIVSIDMHTEKDTYSHLPKYTLISSAYSAKHMHKVGSTLCKHLKGTGHRDLLHVEILGTRSEEWIFVNAKNVNVCLSLPLCREELKLEQRWGDKSFGKLYEKHYYDPEFEIEQDFDDLQNEMRNRDPGDGLQE